MSPTLPPDPEAGVPGALPKDLDLTPPYVEKAAFNELCRIPLNDILDQDSRPTFVLDLDSDYVDYNTKDELRPVFCNSALRLHETLLDNVTGAVEAQEPEPGFVTHLEFHTWATSWSKFDDSRDVFPLTCMYHGMLWTGSTVRQRFRIISGNRCYHVSDVPRDVLRSSPTEGKTGEKALESPRVKDFVTDVQTEPKDVSQAPPPVMASQSLDAGSTTLVASSRPRWRMKSSKLSTSDGRSGDTSGSSGSITLASPEQGVPDWTADHPAGLMSEHMQFARSVDWGSTPLGRLSSWTREFREIANLVMRNPHPAALFWGEELTMLYNEAYAKEVAGNKHPDLMGTGFSGPFSEIWENVSPVFRECARTGKSARLENDMLPIERYGYLEETFFSWSFIPMYGGTDRIMGFYNGPFETTYQTISSRRLQTLRHLGESLAQARSLKHFWGCVLDGLDDNPNDIPFALLYSITDAEDADTASHSSDSTISLKSCLLEGSIGIPDGHPASPAKLDLKRSKEGFIPAFREAMRTREPSKLQTRDGTLPEALLDGIKWRGSGDPCKEAIIIPVRPTNGDTIYAFLLIGINPRRAYDDDYKDFSAMLNRQLATSLASFILFEDEVRQSRNEAEAAALQREKLSRELELQTNRMRRMTELSPLGMYLFSPEGVLLEANERYYEMTGHSRDDYGAHAFMESFIAKSSQDVARSMWDSLKSDLKPRYEEIQIDNPNIVARDLNGEPIEYWVLASSMPEVDMNGKVISIMGSLADISHMKWAQGLQERRLKEAEETKRQQNEFIDITSHEMRNPLSAILICADDIASSLSRHSFTGEAAAVVSECIESANNIALCVQHQKAIVDDILTVSKLDSNLLLITPIPVQPVAIIERAMSMFKPEVVAKNIDFRFCPQESLKSLNLDWVNLDPARLTQITVNLITNAIKFTHTCSKRVISVCLGASLDPPDLQTKGFEYVPMRGPLANVTTGEDWGDGEMLYVRVHVEDTGCGLTSEEKQILFERFAQASPRTHAYYGGSGLGLFISRQLAELHGGQIGVSSEAGVGSTFGFFIQARRVDPPAYALTSAAPPLQVPKPVNPKPPTSHDLSTALPELSTISPEHLQPKKEEDILHILIVEDNIVNQKVLSRQLEKAGCKVATADNGIHALNYLSTTAFQKTDGVPLSVILMDLEMPEMDGLTCVARIRQMETDGCIKEHVPVIAVTANVRGEQIATAMDSGMDAVVSKPFRVHELMHTIERLLERLGNQ
ncbi:hypothetical protein M011DRAFT_479824 [Sporormia fimetaria CBS 119925]|uniref:Aerobic respiration control sensor protein arcB n=1 Tax=Sporormia fimetaria CBS 119925 TaxID=1340428 RepID=A0A6A6V1V2_9PLEO|nr:hypothetical protein M011DRAFT_479824 [Sporormia fimetaria CBS 119925]